MPVILEIGREIWQRKPGADADFENVAATLIDQLHGAAPSGRGNHAEGAVINRRPPS